MKIKLIMKARDVISSSPSTAVALPLGTVRADAPLTDILPRLLDTPDRMLRVVEDDRCLGIIDERSLLEGLNRFIIPRDDCSVITIETAPSAYSASHIAHAVEDADVHLVDLWSAPGEGDKIRVTMRVRSNDPSATVMNLQRYGYDVVYATGNEYRDAELAVERLLEIRTLLNV